METKRINEAVRNNRDKCPISYMFEISSDEVKELRSKNSTTKISSKSRRPTKVFTEKGMAVMIFNFKQGGSIWRVV